MIAYVHNINNAPRSPSTGMAARVNKVSKSSGGALYNNCRALLYSTLLYYMHKLSHRVTDNLAFLVPFYNVAVTIVDSSFTSFSQPWDRRRMNPQRFVLVHQRLQTVCSPLSYALPASWKSFSRLSSAENGHYWPRVIISHYCRVFTDKWILITS